MPFRWEWKYQFWCLAKIMARYPDADGFLWTNDDVMLSYWKFIEANKTKLWMPNNPQSKETRRFKYDETTTGHVRQLFPPMSCAEPESHAPAGGAPLLQP